MSSFGIKMKFNRYKKLHILVLKNCGLYSVAFYSIHLSKPFTNLHTIFLLGTDKSKLNERNIKNYLHLGMVLAFVVYRQ